MLFLDVGLSALTLYFLGRFGVLFLRYFRYRFVSFVQHEHTPDMDSRLPEGYTDRMFYVIGDEIEFYLHSNSAGNLLSVRRMAGPDVTEEIFSEVFGEFPQPIDDNDSELGCEWSVSLVVTVDERFTPGYYQAVLSCEENDVTFPIYFLVGTDTPAAIAIVAPVSTWTAYNAWGGKSLYQNKFENKTVYFASTLRPNSAFEATHDIEAEANIFRWFASEYPDVALYPDYFLESHPDLFTDVSILVLAYHCEYVTRAMYDTVERTVTRGASLISLGANQLYWKTAWRNDYTRLECRKDLSFFEGTAGLGGMWKHHLRSMKKLFGVEFTRDGLHTFAPFMVLKPDHWLFEGTGVSEGELFGERGMRELPIAGVEMDIAEEDTKRIEVVAHSLNCDHEELGRVYDPWRPVWDGSGGGDITIKYVTPKNAILSTGAIYSGTGLGADAVFTAIVKNFVRKYLSQD